tara:strand:+ start:269 stop:1816 length:1548 start_codon:yes stop_codon:yes gene_type:complete
MANQMSFSEYGDIRGGRMRLQTLVEIIEQRRSVATSGSAGPSAVITCEPQVLQDMKDCVDGKLEFDNASGTGDSFAKRYQKRGNAGKILTALKVSGNNITEIKISPASLVKTTEFGGGQSGSGAGSEDTDLFEGAACWVGAFRYTLGTTPLSDDYHCTLDDFRSVEKHVDTKESMEDIHAFLIENNDWMKSSIRTANALYADTRYRNTNFHWYHGNDFVKSINAHFAKVNKAAKEDDPNNVAPFGNINKWNPADIWLCDCNVSSPLANQEQYFAGWNTLLLNLIEQKKLIGVSLKKVTTSRARIERTNMGEQKTTKSFVSVGANSLFGSMDTYFEGQGFRMQMRDTTGKGKTWQGEILGGSAFGVGAKGGKVGGGILNRILESVYGEGNGVFRNYDVDGAIRVSRGNQLDQPIYDLAMANKGVIIQGERGNLYRPQGFNRDRTGEEVTLDNVRDAGGRSGNSASQWKFSKFLGLEVVDIVMSGNAQQRNEVSTKLYRYAASKSDQSAPFLKVQSS